MPKRSEAGRPAPWRGPLRLPGVVALVVAAGLIGVGGWGFGLVELTGLGIAVLLVVIVGVVEVTVRRPAVTCSRTVRPVRVFAGGVAEVTLVITHTGRGRSPALHVHDPIERPDGWRTVAVGDIAPLAPGRRRSITYTVACPDRGLCRIGPAGLRFSDPFGVASRSVPGPGMTTVTILPRVVDVSPPAPDRGGGHAGVVTGVAGDAEFASLRTYTPGDDLRRVHWRSSARRDELMIRQDEDPRRWGCTVVLDVQPCGPSPRTFERIVSAAASILVAVAGAGHRTRLVTTAGVDSGDGSGAEHLDGILVALATVVPAARVTNPPSGDGDRIVIVTADPELAGTPSAVRVLFADDPRTGDPRTVPVGPDDRFAEVWEARARADRRGWS